MKILHTSDLHFNTQWFEWIANQQDEYDVFVISGDFLDSSKEESLVEQIVWVSAWIRAFNKPLFVCSGNHDIEEFDDEEWLNRIDTENYYPDNSKKNIEGIRFGCYPFIGAEGYYDFDDVDVLITHVPPACTDVAIASDSKDDWGDRELYDALVRKTIKPKMILCGHMHNPISQKCTIGNTEVFNAAYGTGDMPLYHSIDLII
jgi:Icc-related predicted phosphoesterase